MRCQHCLLPAILTASGTLYGYITYAPYGLVISLDPELEALTDPTALATSQRFDPNTGLYDYRARFYDPLTGSFVQPDSIVPSPLDPRAWNRFSYVYGNPTNYTDPSGHIPIWDALDVAGFAWSFYDFYNDPTWGNAGWLALDTVGLLPFIPAVGTVRHAGKLGKVDEVKAIEIYGFRGTGSTAEEFIDSDPLIYAGHIGISFDGGKTIYGFTPYAPGLSNMQAIDVLKQHKTFPGQVLDDTALFHRAQDLADQGYRTQVYVQSISVSKTDFKRIRKQVLSELKNSPLPNKRYSFPGPPGCFNCATWPSSHGIPIPEATGNVRLYMAELMKVGRPWVR